MRSPTLLILSILSKTKTKENYEVNMRMILGAIAVAVCMEGCNTVEHSALPEASVSGDIVRASFTITENPDRCECTDSGKKVTREGFRRAITQLAKMPPGKELDLSVTTDYLCWQECYPRDYESELSALSALTNFESISLAIRETHGKLDFSALAKLPLRNLTIDKPLCMPSPYLEVSGLESSPVERLTLIGCFGVKGFCDLPRLETCECKLDALGCYEIPASEIRSRFPSVRSVFGNGVYPPDLPLCIATNGVTSLSYREWGALNGPDERYSIDFAQRRVSAEVYNYSLRDNANPCVLKCERLCNREDWEKLLACIEEANVVGWEERYSANICDGTLWRVELVNGTNIVKRIDGNNAAPSEFKKFCAVKQIVFGKFGGCSLWYPKLREEMLESINAADACAENESGKEATK